MTVADAGEPVVGPASVADNLQQAAPALFNALWSFPVPLAILDAEGSVELANRAMASQFDDVSFGQQRLQSLPGVCEERIVRLNLSQGDRSIDAHALVIPLGGQYMLIPGYRAEAALEEEMRALRGLVGELEKAAATDHLTGLWNRAHFDRCIGIEIERSRELHRPLSLALLDIDHFKHVNDTFGHDAGDRVLVETADLVRGQVRCSDDLFRWGGEEFALLLRDTGHRGAERVAQKIRESVSSREFAGVGALTLSAGVAEHDGDEDSSGWFKRLDVALYEAKSQGRNRVVVDRRGDSNGTADHRPTPMLQLQWQEAYECGEETIDEQHRELFRRANLLMDALISHPADVARSLSELIAHARLHFASEEAILDRAGYRGLKPHRIAHEMLLKRAEHLFESAQCGEAGLGEVVEFVTQELVARHLLTADRSFASLFSPS